MLWGVACVDSCNDRGVISFQARREPKTAQERQQVTQQEGKTLWFRASAREQQVHRLRQMQLPLHVSVTFVDHYLCIAFLRRCNVLYELPVQKLVSSRKVVLQYCCCHPS